eukprot:3841-Heterococcus_DN1.PRE.2
MRAAGTVVHADVLREAGSRRSKGCGIVEYDSAEEASTATTATTYTSAQDRHSTVPAATADTATADTESATRKPSRGRGGRTSRGRGGKALTLRPALAIAHWLHDLRVLLNASLKYFVKKYLTWNVSHAAYYCA